MEILCQQKRFFTPIFHSYLGYLYVCHGDEKTTYTSGGFLRLHVDICPPYWFRKRGMLNLIVALDLYIQILFAQIEL